MASAGTVVRKATGSTMVKNLLTAVGKALIG